MEYKDTILFLPDKEDIERDAVALAWRKRGGEVLKIGKFWNPPMIENKYIKVYGNNMFCLILEQKLNIKLIFPDDELLIKLRNDWTKRKIDIVSLDKMCKDQFPAFIKPVVPKLFTAQIYKSMEELKKECKGLEESTKVIISEIVHIESEVRCFILNQEIITLSVYEGEVADYNEVTIFIDNFLKFNHYLLPKTLVLDVGYVKDRGWIIIEANPTWGAGLNGCNPEKAIICILEATQ